MSEAKSKSLTSAQHSVMTYKGKKSKTRVDVCICITDSLNCTAEINTDCKSTILQYKF